MTEISRASKVEAGVVLRDLQSRDLTEIRSTLEGLSGTMLAELVRIDTREVLLDACTGIVDSNTMERVTGNVARLAAQILEERKSSDLQAAE